ncbi:MAG TPA: AlkA N-terminal domain-containing protein [Candidatus Binatia bacterium]|jgi:AraC family transcriptional regulator of adaptative response / DNA-3-methyladenine glycosylase II
MTTTPTTLDRDVCYRAIRTRDARFDGKLLTAVLTTGIYCRPICPARTPKLENVVFYASAAAAQEAGFRPCLRCRPESSPELAAWRGTSNTVSRALTLIADGALDGGERDVGGLAARLGIGERQLRRLFQQHLGASPIAVAQTRRVLFAKQLIHETRMRMIDVALASGFGSLRRFNDTFHRLYDRPPSSLRRLSPSPEAGAGAAITVRLSYAPPYDWAAMIAFLAARAVPGVEIVEPRRYRRTIELDGQHGTIDVAPVTGANAVAATIRFPNVRALPSIIRRIRRLFDLTADIRSIAAHLAEDPLLAPLVRARPGLRVPGAWDGFELAIRAILGQQITVAAARQLAVKLVAAHGEPFAPAASGDAPALSAVFPRAERLAGANLARLGMPRARATALSSLAAAAVADARLFSAEQDLECSVARLRDLPGVGEWTAQYIALRALHEPDAFPAGDIGILRALATGDERPTAAAALARAEAWRPWRAYAAQHLWTNDNVKRVPPSRARQEAVA